MKTALVIMAAGVGSRFGGGIKQLSPVGPNGEIIMDYSIHDAIAAGFDKIVFIIRRDIEADFREVIGRRVERVCGALGVETAYVFQRLDDLPDGVALPAGRVKPWGTCQAVLACRDVLREPFCVINADDYYGREAYAKLHGFLSAAAPERPFEYAMAGFMLGNTLSDNGGVTRGLCRTNADGLLTDVEETPGIVRAEGGALAGGRLIPLHTPVSMNMWALTPSFLGLLQEGFAAFFRNIAGRELTAEFLLPIFIGQLLREGRATVRMLPTFDQWFGVTYQADREPVIAAVRALIERGLYRADLYADLAPRRPAEL